MQHTLVAVFDNRADAQSAMNELLSSGYSSQEVRLSEEAGAMGGASATSPTSTMGTTSTTGATGSTDEGFGSGIKHFFADLFGSDHDEPQRKYSEAVNRGSHVLTVTTATLPEVERAADLIERFGPVDIDEKASQWGGASTTGATGATGASSGAMAAGSMSGGAMGSGSGAQQAALLTPQSQPGSTASQQGSAMGGSQQLATGENTAIPIIEEQLQVGKREVQRGGVRVYQRMVETPVTETVNLREEHVNVERRPVDQPVNPAELAAFQEKSIELRETGEEVVVQKTARVVEEVVIGKEVTQTQQQVNDTVRRTEVEVEQLGGTTGSTTGSSTGTTTGSTMGSTTGTGTSDDDTYYRNHFNTNLASSGGKYEEYAPAYGYGSTMAGNDQYRGRSWDDAEPSLRSDWESRNQGSGSTWEKMKASVRHGWDKVAH
jgi:uncharacterized protein (TIGR02271 family)